MAGAKVIVLYPTPLDTQAFERDYTVDHAPMVTAANFPGITKFVASKILATPDGSPPSYYRVAELHFPSLDALQKATGSASAQPVIAHAVSISTGGRPVFLVAEEDTRTY